MFIQSASSLSLFTYRQFTAFSHRVVFTLHVQLKANKNQNEAYRFSSKYLRFAINVYKIKRQEVVVNRFVVIESLRVHVNKKNAFKT